MALSRVWYFDYKIIFSGILHVTFILHVNIWLGLGLVWIFWLKNNVFDLLYNFDRDIHVSFTILYHYNACILIPDLTLDRVRFFHNYIIIKEICNAYNLYLNSTLGRVWFSDHYFIIKEIMHITFIWLGLKAGY